ncbi:MAG: ABC transporter permease [Calditrichaeota bacterium]|nr:MAG: ABC transporter permease [Calditrichota bacterium]
MQNPMRPSALKYWLDYYRAEIRAALLIQLQYRAAFVIWLLEMIIEPVVYLVVWSTVARARGGEVGGFAPQDFAAYFIVFMLVNHLTYSWTFWVFEERVRTGKLSFRLLRPVHPVHSDLAFNLTYKFLTLVVMAPTGVGLTLAFHPAFHFTTERVLLAAPALILAFAVRFVFEWAYALLAFWTTRIMAFNEMYYVVLLFLSGQVAPLSLFPQWVQDLSYVLPFRWMVAFPVELLLGHLDRLQIVAGFTTQIAWLAVSFMLMRWLWARGVRRYSAVGG